MIAFLPKTKIGRRTVGLIICFFLLFIAFHFMISLQGPRDDQTFFDNPPRSIMILLVALSGISAFVTGVISLIKQGERSILVFLATLIGLFILFFLIGEFVTPH